MSIFKTPAFYKEFTAELKGKKVLDLGCGTSKLPGAIGVDLFSFDGVDCIHNLNQVPYPFEPNSIDAIVMNHVVEHLEFLPTLIEEAHRLLKQGGQLWIATPHFTDADSWGDPTHKYHFSVRSMMPFTDKFNLKLAYVSLKGFWKGIGYERWINDGAMSGKPSRRAERWENKHCFVRRGGEMYFILQKK